MPTVENPFAPHDTKPAKKTAAKRASRRKPTPTATDTGGHEQMVVKATAVKKTAARKTAAKKTASRKTTAKRARSSKKS